jgi:class 3 adenylate cyclase
MRYGTYRERGRLAEIEHELDVNIERLTDAQVPLFRASRAALYAEIGQLVDAQEELDILSERGFAEVREGNWLGTLAFLGEACAAVGDTEKAAELYTTLEPYAERNTQLGASVWTPVSRILGLLAANLGRDEEADGYFAEALDMCDRLQSPPLKARTELDYAEALHRRGDDKNAACVRSLVASSLEVAEELGMNSLVERALKLKLDTDGLLSTGSNSSIENVGALVTEKRPDLSDHANPDGTVTLLFSDIEDYTGLLDRLGDVAAHQLVQEHNAIVRDLTRTHDGTEVELRGDGFLLAFADPAGALRCAISLQQAFAHRNATAEIPIRIRIGLHTGETIRDADTFFGSSVVAAFRVADLAQGGEVLVTEAVRAAVAEAGFSFDAGREVELKGFEEQQRVFSTRLGKQ